MTSKEMHSSTARLSDTFDVAVIGGGAAFSDPFSNANEARLSEIVLGDRRHGI